MSVSLSWRNKQCITDICVKQYEMESIISMPAQICEIGLKIEKAKQKFSTIDIGVEILKYQRTI